MNRPSSRRNRARRDAYTDSLSRKSKHRPRELLAQFRYLKKHIDKFWEFVTETSERLHDLEVHADLMQRILVTLAIQKMDISLGELRRLIRQVEKEAIAESEVYELEQLFEMPAKKPAPHKAHRKKKKK